MVVPVASKDVQPTDGKKGDNVQVVVRIRPENENEKASMKSRIIVCAMGPSLVAFDPKEVDPLDYFHGKALKHRDINKRANKDLKFAFDRVFDEFASNSNLYDGTTKLTLESLLDGYNCSVFAYGATGSGKTFSMLGNPDNPGVIYLTMVDLYWRLEELKEEKMCEVKVSYLEVYNEQIRDLLPPSTGLSPVMLPLREDPRAGVVVKGLTLHSPKTVEELLHMLSFGNSNRTQHPTDANAESSRSHAVFQVFVQMRPRTAGVSTDVQVAKMSLIDLAGSERATVTKNRGARFREGANINRSLLALGNVINALADSRVKSQHVPYRDSKLTRLLKDSLGGNCRTVMIAAVSPSSLTYEDTYNTLRYADRAKRIRTQLKKNIVNVDVHISRYSHIIDELRQEITELKCKLETRESVVSIPVPVPPSMDVDKVCKLQEVLHAVFESRMSIRREILEFESCERDIAWRLSCKRTYLNRFSTLNNEATASEAVVEADKVRRSIVTTESRLENISRRRECVHERLKDNCDWLTNVENEAGSISGDGQIPEILGEKIRAHHLEVEVADCRRHIKHLAKMTRSYERERQNEEALITELLTTVRHQRAVLTGHDWVTSDLDDRYGKISSMVLYSREVTWADHDTVTRDDTAARSFTDMSVTRCANASPSTPKRQRISRVTAAVESTPTAAIVQTPVSSRTHSPTPTRTKLSDTQVSPTPLDLSTTLHARSTERGSVVEPWVLPTPGVAGGVDASNAEVTSLRDLTRHRNSIECAGHTPFMKKLPAVNRSPVPVLDLDAAGELDEPAVTVEPSGENPTVDQSRMALTAAVAIVGPALDCHVDGVAVLDARTVAPGNAGIGSVSTPLVKLLPHPLARLGGGLGFAGTCRENATAKPGDPATKIPKDAKCLNRRKLGRSATVTKLSYAENRENVPTQPRTITKSVTTTNLQRVSDENNAPKNSVIRAIQFSAGSPTFADIVKSPMRSPLLSMCPNTLNALRSSQPLTAQFSKPRAPLPDTLTQKPRSVSSADDRDSTGFNQPNYMQMTKAATRKQMFKRSTSTYSLLDKLAPAG